MRDLSQRSSIGLLLALMLLPAPAWSQDDDTPAWQGDLRMARVRMQQAAEAWGEIARKGEHQAGELEALVKTYQEAREYVQQAADKGAPEEVVDRHNTSIGQGLSAIERYRKDGVPTTEAPGQAKMAKATALLSQASQDWSEYLEQGSEDEGLAQIIIETVEMARKRAREAEELGYSKESVQTFVADADRLIATVRERVGLESAEDPEQSDRPPLLVDRAELGYQVYASSEWAEKPVVGGGDIDRMIERADPDCNLTFIPLPADGLTEISEYILQTVYEEVKKKYSTESLLQQKVEPFHGKPAGWYEFTGEMEGQAGLVLHVRQYFVIHADRIYVLTVTCTDDQWEAAKPHFQAVLKNLRFVE